MNKRYLEVIELETGDVVKRIDVSGKTDRHVERAEMGLLRNMNFDAYSVRDTLENDDER